MLKNWKKIIAMFLIFTITFGDFALVGKAYATSIFDGIFKEEQDAGDTGSANVEFNAYIFDNENDENTSVKSDIKNDKLNLKMNVKVKNSGYLKDAKILLGNGKGLNFKMDSSKIEENKNIEEFKDNELSLVQLNSGSEVLVEFPISYEAQKFVDINNVSKTNVIRFVGTYVNDNAEEIPISKDIEIKLSWIDERDIKINSEVTKYIGYSSNDVSGVILQTLIQADNTTENTSLPVKDTEVTVEVPVIDEQKPSSINVVAKSTAGTNGKQNNDVIFSNDNWSYDEESNKLTIKVENKPELVSTQNEDDILIDETIPKEERYYSNSGMDEYLITYTYKNLEMNSRKISSKAVTLFNMYGGSSLKAENTFEYEVSEKVGDIVTFSVENSTDSISKGYTYLNYNNPENKNEMEINNKLIFNVSYKDIVESLHYSDMENSYITKDGNSLKQDDIYYKKLTISKENFIQMLGEDGYVNIYNSNNELLFTINKDVETTEDGNYDILLDSSIKGIQLQTSKPINDGNLIFSVVRAYSNVSYDKENYKNFDKLTINTVGKAKYIYLDELADCGNSNLEIKLEDTKTKAELEIGQDNLSTLAVNNNVELKIKLNNENIQSDIYGQSSFEIKMPEYVESLEVTDASIVYGEGLEISNVSAYEKDGSIYLKVDVSGMQNALSSGIVSKGTNIVLNTNIKVNLFAPAMEGKFELTYTNSEATNYSEENQEKGYSETLIRYSAPSGVVSVNSISEYNDKGEVITSVKQGKVQGEIPVYSDVKNAKIELTIMNNEQNEISNIAILGRIPYKGVKDLITNEDIGTTISSKMLSRISSDSSNNGSFTIFYSENGEATKDLNDESNGWTVSPENLENVKSYLIVPEDSNYVMDVASKLRFTYTFEIPANLEHNEEIYGTFATYYTNNTDVATLNETSVADFVGLTTGDGPKFDYETKVNKTSVNEFETFEIEVAVKNTGKATAKDVVVQVPIPEYTRYVSALADKEGVNFTYEEPKVTFNLESLEVGDTVKFKVNVEADDLYTEEREIVSTNVYSTLTATDLDTIIEIKPVEVTITQAELRVSIDSEAVVQSIVTKGNEVLLFVRIKNLKNETIKNITGSLNIGDEFEFVEAYVTGYAEDGLTVTNVRDANYDSSTKTITWNIDEIESLDIASIKVKLDVKLLQGNEKTKEVALVATSQADNIPSYSSVATEFIIGKPILNISQTTLTTNTYVKEGETINYKFTINNEGSVSAQSLSFIDEVPDGLVVKKVSYETDGVLVEQDVSEKDLVRIGSSVAPGKTLDVNIEAVAVSLNGVQELSVTNGASVTATNVDTVHSNSITHIIESSGKVVSEKGESSSGLASSSTNETMSSISKTYKITGTAWIDADKDGMRSDTETLMKGVKATLVDSDAGVIKQTTVTNSNGEYTFTGVKNGNYIIIFDYDTVLYTVTVYQKENVTSNVNSDVITTKIEQDGVLRNGAVTDVITVADGSISNIDIGLVEALKFDLSLDMGISKITVQNSKGTNTVEYDNSKLTKTEIAAKQIAGSVVYFEYTFKVKNEGEISGYAKNIVDYIPEDMNFNSGMNPEWYTGTDGNLYTTQLSNVEIMPGETKTFTLVLSRTMTNESTGSISNTAEIAEDYNIYGVSDLDSTPSNKIQNEDDFARADSYLSVKTGEVFIYISVIITTILLVGIAVFIIIIKLRYRLVKGGV